MATNSSTPTSTSLTDPARRAHGNNGPRPVRIHEWRAEQGPPPMVLLSHGTGGQAQDLAWWAAGLCAAGFDVLAVDHHGNTSVEPYVAEAFVRWWDRPQDLSFALDQVEVRGPVGVAGFSLGGYTAAAICGARLDREVCSALRTGALDLPGPPEYPGLAEELRTRDEAGTVQDWAARASSDHRDRRVRSGFLLCPALGPLLEPESLAAIDVPVAVRWTASDTEAPPEENGVRYARGIPGADGDTVGGPDSGHYGFVMPEYDDPQAKADVMAESITFFRRTLG
ncbi:alpha/beta hydrolase family protein [Brachybacterium sp. GCM10030267]|uniref:alpha/beta hydrolase family protein n=1 Tax=Brachybacterium sp. GCM10030267 TaxID=3273381 RepID=UPI00361F61D7